MNTLELAAQLEECLHLARRDITAADKEMFKNARGVLSAELNTLLQEAVDMKWPFVEEKWQYKRSVAVEDKVNTTELIGKHLPQLMLFLRASIMAAEPAWAMSVIFLLDRFLYWMDGSHTLLKIAKALHMRYPDTQVAPQIIIRQARVYLNTGKLQKAEYILSSLINNNGATGCWKYQRECDRILVQSVCVQVRGQVLQKLGLWLEAAELIWASLVGFYVLPLPDKKGIGASLGLLANILNSMNEKDFATFQKKPHINLSYLGDCSHRLLCAAQAAKMAAVYSQFSSLFALTHMVAQGTCLLSYSFSSNCPAPAKHTYLNLAKEAFENGLLTKKDIKAVTSQQELHTLLRAAYSLAITNRWLFGLSAQVNAAVQACQEAVGLFYTYCFKDDSDKNLLSSKVMAKLQLVKALLKTKPYKNSDPRSFIPDSYRAIEDRPIPFTMDDFAKLLECFQKHHKSVCEAFSVQRCGVKKQDAGHADCITAFLTRTESFATECHTTSHKSSENFSPEFSDRLVETIPDTIDCEEKKQGKKRPKAEKTRLSGGSSSLGSSWTSLSDIAATSPVLVDPFCCTDVDDDNDGFVSKHKRCNYPEDKSAQTANASNQTRTDLSLQPISNNLKTNMQELCITLGSEDNKDGCTGDSKSNVSHPTSTDFSFLSSSSHGRSNQTLCTTLGSEENYRNNYDGTDKKTGTSSESISSLGSSWQSVSFSKSPHFGDLTEAFENKQAADQNCDTLPSEGGPASSFECLNLNSSASFIQKEHFSSSFQTGNDASKSQTGSLDHKQSLPSTEFDSFEFLQVDEPEAKQENSAAANNPMKGNIKGSPPVENKDDAHKRSHMASNKNDTPFSNMSCRNGCFQGCTMGSVVLSEQDYRSLLSGVCQGCLLRRLPDKPFQLSHYNKAYSALLLKYSKTTDSWTACETNVFVGEVLKMDVEGKQRKAFRVQYLHQEILLGSYVGKEYLKERKIDTHLGDVERQMTAQFYVMEFNKRLYESNITTQIFYLPSELLLLLESDTIIACVSVEPYMLGEFVKLTNNTTKINNHHSTTEYGIAFGHFTYEFSNKQEVVVDLQGWMTANGKGLMYLTDPQIHTLRKPRSVNNFHQNGIRKFLQDQHGEHCNSICTRAALHTLPVLSEN
ncbi:alpha-protein kinase 1 [Clarias gariepinus]|uniref:alpha-protein kinase 1 n=1 Tax=Clarias gariepinus TaxID=13013 RepID=UPI00234C377E|nr:alpha-protein kinase 1 [Clarias gariepinus]XP_053336111.1 alpha-protein kinase 1 [Clarias gariepinus]XP_053336112.1 alpha-protein kinase 1 [Clarias gariepinus]XP_053336113.1 alpha-protein kinase 1 [Clarias gariepinus]